MERKAKLQRINQLRREKARREEAEHLETYAPTNLHVRTESEGIRLLRFNRVQLHVHTKIEEQKARTGRVRALILKARKQGCSTYVAARYYHQTTHEEGIQTTIIAHEKKATDTLFGIVNLFYERDPHPPLLAASNANALAFKELVSGYSVLTAGKKGTGRSQTPQKLHASEFAFWPNAKDHRKGIIQAVPNVDGSEIIIESTANGVGNEFHAMWQEAEAGQSDYIAIFVPWYFTAHYRLPVPKDFSLTDEDLEYQELFGLDLEQMSFRRSKIAELGDEFAFKQEYPATAAEAFETSGEDKYIPARLVVKARKTQHAGIGPLIIGADPARYGTDRFSLAWRRGRKVLKVESRSKLSIPEGAAWIKSVIDREKPARVFIDVGGLGAGTYDILVGWGKPYVDIVKAVNFAGAPLEPWIYLENGDKRAGPKNKRAEMWMHSKKFLEQEGGADIPDKDSLQTDACGPKYKYDITTQHLLIEGKDEMIRRGVRSPDEWDAVVLTFAEPVADVDPGRPAVTPRARDSIVGV